MFEQIAANRRRSALLIVVFTALMLVVGWIFGYATGAGWWGVAAAFAFAVALSFYSYYYSDKLVIALSRAKRADPAVHTRYVNVVEGLSIAAGIPVPKAYVIEDEAPNAFATGRNPQHAAVAVTTGLLQKMNRVELEGVVAHELSHVRNHDILVATVAVVLAGMLILLSDWTIRSLRWGGLRRGGRSKEASAVGALLVGVGFIILLLAPLLAQLLKAAVSRRREALADVSAVELTRYPPGLIEALKKLRDDSSVVRTATHATAHLWIESPLQRKGRGMGVWLNRLFDTHPPIEERIRLLESL